MEGHTYIMEIDSIYQDKFFDATGQLLAQGRVQYWKELDQKLKDFDRKKLCLLPVGTLPPDEGTVQNGKKQGFDTPNSAPRNYQDRYHIDNRVWRHKGTQNTPRSRFQQGFNRQVQGSRHLPLIHPRHSKSARKIRRLLRSHAL